MRNSIEPTGICQAPVATCLSCWMLVNQAEVLAALQPLLVVENRRRQLNQPRQHVEHRNRTPLRAFAPVSYTHLDVYKRQV